MAYKKIYIFFMILWIFKQISDDHLVRIDFLVSASCLFYLLIFKNKNSTNNKSIM